MRPRAIILGMRYVTKANDGSTDAVVCFSDLAASVEPMGSERRCRRLHELSRVVSGLLSGDPLPVRAMGREVRPQLQSIVTERLAGLRIQGWPTCGTLEPGLNRSRPHPSLPERAQLKKPVRPLNPGGLQTHASNSIVSGSIQPCLSKGNGLFYIGGKLEAA